MRYYFNVRSKASLIYRTELKDKKWGKVKVKTDMLRSIGKQSGGIGGVSPAAKLKKKKYTNNVKI